MSLASTTDHPAATPAKKARSPRSTRPSDPAIDRATGRKLGKRQLGYKKVSFFLPPDLVKRLEIKAVAEDLDTSEVLQALLLEADGLKRWRLQEVGKYSDQATLGISSDRADS